MSISGCMLLKRACLSARATTWILSRKKLGVFDAQKTSGFRPRSFVGFWGEYENLLLMRRMNHHNGKHRMMHELLGDRAEHEAGKATVTARTYH